MTFEYLFYIILDMSYISQYLLSIHILKKKTMLELKKIMNFIILKEKNNIMIDILWIFCRYFRKFLRYFVHLLLHFSRISIFSLKKLIFTEISMKIS